MSSKMTPVARGRLTALIFLSAVLFLFFFGMDRIPLWSSDEGRYGEIAREMWESRNFIVPQFNSFVTDFARNANLV